MFQKLSITILFISLMRVMHSFPSSCPNILNYEFDGQKYYGVIILPTNTMSTVMLNVTISVPTMLASNFGGKLIPDIQQNQIIYYVQFPLTSQIPKITEIYFNNQLVCSDSPAIGSYVTTIRLFNVLTRMARPGHGQFPPNPTNDILTIPNNVNYETSINIPQYAPGVNQLNNNTHLEQHVWPQLFSLDSTSTQRTQFTPYPILQQTVTIQQTQPNVNHVDFNQQTTTQTLTQQTTTQIPKQQMTTPKSVKPNATLENQNTENICGHTEILNPLIVRGYSVNKGEYPWLAALFVNLPLGLEFKCGGSLVTHRHIVTAAHCVKFGKVTVTTSELMVVLGKHNIRKWSGDKESIILDTQEIIIHPEFTGDSSELKFDIAIIRTNERIEYTNYIRPICLWKTDADLTNVVGRSGTIAGWGRDENGNKITAVPMQIQAPIVSQEECLRSNSQFVKLTSTKTFCAGTRDDSGPCNGDSGSGYMLVQNDRWTLRGIVSVSLEDKETHSCNLKQYVVFTDAAKFYNWINDNVKNAL